MRMPDINEPDYYNAFETSPVPPPGPDAVSPGVYRGIYGMPMFVTLPTADLDASRRFWIDALGFIDLFSIPGQLTHLRRWAFQDVLLVPGEAQDLSERSVSFACITSEIDEFAARCEAALPGSTTAPRHTPWNTIDLEVITPEHTRVLLTAAKPLDPASVEARNLADIGIGA